MSKVHFTMNNSKVHVTDDDLEEVVSKLNEALLGKHKRGKGFWSKSGHVFTINEVEVGPIEIVAQNVCYFRLEED